ncbi:MAG: thiamine-phosphate kinase [Steroidobacteraceae bacterium]
MAAGEFDLIARYFRPLGLARTDVRLGIGDDAAVLQLESGSDLVVTTDALVHGRHFLDGAAPRSLGHRALAVNLSDLAAMGAQPAWALLALTLPQADEPWLREFAQGLGALARQHDVALVGGNMARGPFNICVQLLGNVPRGAALLRSGARAGDGVYVTGTPGDAAAGRESHAGLRERFEYPSARVTMGIALRGIASACIDVSDGLLADLGKLLQASGAGAELECGSLPLSAGLLAAVGREAGERIALMGGEDYELCFAVPPSRQAAIAALRRPDLCSITQIGTVVRGSGVTVLRGGQTLVVGQQGFDHFPI